MADKKYEIIISVDQSSATTATTGEQLKNSDVTNNALKWSQTDIAKGAKMIAGFYGATSLARSAIHAGVGLMSVQTGNELQQRRVETTISLVETGISAGIMFAINPVAGATYAAGQAISLIAESEKNTAAINKQSMSANYIRERAGGAFNRSRRAGSF